MGTVAYDTLPSTSSKGNKLDDDCIPAVLSDVYCYLQQSHAKLLARILDTHQQQQVLENAQMVALQHRYQRAYNMSLTEIETQLGEVKAQREQLLELLRVHDS